MAQIKFTETELKSFKRKPAKGGEASFSASLTVAVCKAMGWLDKDGNPAVADILTGATPEGDLGATSIVLESKKGNLAEYQIEIKAQRVFGFECVRRELEGKRGKGHRYDLLFKVSFADLTGCRFLEEYMVKAGDSKGTLTVTYEPQAEQKDLVEPKGKQTSIVED